MTTYEINDGPDYAPNFKRRVVEMDFPPQNNFVYVRDVRTGEILRIDRGRLDRARKVEAPGKRVDKSGCLSDYSKQNQ